MMYFIQRIVINIQADQQLIFSTCLHDIIHVDLVKQCISCTQT